MSVTTPSVGLLVDGPASPEREAAREWAATATRSETVALDALPGRDPAFDALWWHRARPLDDVDRDVAAALRRYVEDGGGLLLSLRALSAVPALGVDPVAPDDVGEESAEASGPLVHPVYATHPALSGLDGLRTPTGAGGPHARYRGLLPAEGTVLAGWRRDGEDDPAGSAIVEWRVGDGAVLGVGAGLAFGGDDHARARNRLAAGALDWLGGGSPAADVPLRDDHAGLRAALADDPHRPAYHVAAPANWLNDPNGLIHYGGRFHLFYQYNPGGPYHGTIYWGHAVSDDLVSWEDEPVALAPSPDGPDRDGCWSGCAVEDDGRVTLFYTGGRGRRQRPCRAVARDDALRAFEKDPDNPIIEPPAGEDLLTTPDWEPEFRDHAVWRGEEAWYHLVGSGIEGRGGTALLYESSDLETWTYRGPVLVGDEGDGAMWECPELLDFGGKQLLHVSNYDGVVYFLGEFDPAVGRFEPERRDRLDYGDFYAPQSLTDDRGRRLTWGWLRETRPPAAQWDAGWSGLLSLPRVLDLGPTGRLRQRPAPELQALRRDHAGGAAFRVGPDATRRLDLRGRAVELRLDLSLDGAEALDLRVRESPDGDQATVVRYTGDALVLDRSAAGEGSDQPLRMPLEAVERDPLQLHVFVDRSSVEAFAGERRCLTGRVYPDAGSDRLSLRAHGGPATVRRLDAWRLASAWE